MERSLNQSLNHFLVTTLLVYSTGFALAVGFSIVTNEIHHRQMAALIGYSEGKQLQDGNLRQAILGLENAREQYYSGIGYFQPAGEKVFLIPAAADVTEFKDPGLWSRITTARYTKDVFLGRQEAVKLGTLVFLYARFAYVPYALAIWLASLILSVPLLLRMRNRMIHRHEEEADLRRRAELAKQAEDVAHNIRSPLAALDNLLESAKALPEDERILMRSATVRIRDIANMLIAKHGADNKADAKEFGVYLISSLIEAIVSEKRVHYRKRTEIEIDASFGPESYGLFARMQPAEFKAILSNLINNSIEAMRSGKVLVSLRSTGTEVAISVADNGPGIPDDILHRLTQRGATFGKADGKGIGLNHAKTILEKWRGRLDIRSAPGAGTTITVILPKELPPSWFVPEIRLSPQTAIIVLDDDLSIHQVWEQRFKTLSDSGAKPEILHASTPEDFRNLVAKQSGPEAIFLVDYELLNCAETGLDLIEELGIESRSILVTSRFEDAAVPNRCNHLGVRLIPKAIANLVPIRAEASADPGVLDGILIDDDPFTRMMWQSMAEQKGRRILVFEGSHAFLASAERIPRQTPIYVDRRLGEELGDEVSRRVSELGFSEVWLATGEIAETLPTMPWLRGVIGKRPPW